MKNIKVLGSGCRNCEITANAIGKAAELAGVDVDTIYTFNPGYNRWSTDPAGPHQLVMPVDVAESFSTALASVPERERVRWKRHKVKNGEAISQIANKYNTTVSAIRSAGRSQGSRR